MGGSLLCVAGSLIFYFLDLLLLCASLISHPTSQRVCFRGALGEVAFPSCVWTLRGGPRFTHGLLFVLSLALGVENMLRIFFTNLRSGSWPSDLGG